MRRAFNLIELIFTIVIMAGIFAVIPKIIFATNKSDSFAMKQDALFNAVSLTNIASSLAWDENNSESLSLLATLNNNIPCNTTTFLRLGGFLGDNTRNCKELLSASAIGSEEGNNYLIFDDIDDFNGSSIDVNIDGNEKYKLYTEVRYLDDAIFNPVVNNKMTITLDSSIHANTSNIKKFKTVVGYVGGRGKDKNISSFYYYSTNIGQITLNSEAW